MTVDVGILSTEGRLACDRIVDAYAIQDKAVTTRRQTTTDLRAAIEVEI